MYGEFMMIEKECAKTICEHALKAVSELTHALNVIHGRCSEEEYEKIRKGIGLSIGKIQTDILDIVYSAYPELDDLK
jgi:hypothetical protein